LWLFLIALSFCFDEDNDNFLCDVCRTPRLHQEAIIHQLEATLLVSSTDFLKILQWWEKSFYLELKICKNFHSCICPVSGVQLAILQSNFHPKQAF